MYRSERVLKPLPPAACERLLLEKYIMCRLTPVTASSEKVKDFFQCSLEIATSSMTAKGDVGEVSHG